MYFDKLNSHKITKALDSTSDEFMKAEKHADKFGDELKDTASDVEASSSKFEKLGNVVKGVGGAISLLCKKVIISS